MIQRIKLLRPAYALIDLQNYKHNIEVAKKLSNSKLILVIKADAYGHGAIKLSEFAYKECGIRFFAVATVEEAMTIRNRLEKANILILGFVDEEFFDEIVKYNLIPTIYDYSLAIKFNNYLYKRNMIHKVAVKIDTGMNRLGFDTSFDITEFKREYRNLDISLLMTHLSSADSDEQYTLWQLERFDNFLKKSVKKVDTSVFNSAGICNFENKYTFTRPGIMTYGYCGVHSEKLKPVMKVYSKLVHIKNIKRGEKVSYNQTYTAEKDMRIGIVPFGYADGYFRCLSNKGYMYVNGKKCRVLGSVCMDMTVIDITDLSENDLEHEVEIIGDNIDAEKIAEMANTISYEIICNISPRIPRIYKYD